MGIYGHFTGFRKFLKVSGRFRGFQCRSRGFRGFRTFSRSLRSVCEGFRNVSGGLQGFSSDSQEVAGGFLRRFGVVSEDLRETNESKVIF